MHKSINLDGIEVVYDFKRYSGSKNIKRSLFSTHRVLVTAPKRVRESDVNAFIISRSGWILPLLGNESNVNHKKNLLEKKMEYKKLKRRAEEILSARLRHFNAIYGFRFKSVKIRNQSSRWGSCSSSGSINFNYRLILLDQELIDYVVVHELCHLREMNHSPAFWKIKKKSIPNYKVLKKKLARLS